MRMTRSMTARTAMGIVVIMFLLVMTMITIIIVTHENN